MGACTTKPSCAPQSPQVYERPENLGDRTPGGQSAASPAASPTSTTTSIKSYPFCRCNPGKIKDVYIIEEKTIGVGSYGSVVKGTHRVTKKVRAIKMIPKSKLKNIDKFNREVDIMKMLDHPNIIKLFETFQDSRTVYLAMEMCSGGELFDRILEASRLTEREASIVAQQILRAIFYMHDKGVIHRDLKPENFLFATKDVIERSLLKIIDFGLSCSFKLGETLSTRAGTPYYVAPQVLAGKYDHACDLWSVGVIMYVLLCGYPPFYGKTDHEVLSKVRKGVFTYPERDWGHVTSDAKDLIRELLCHNPKERFTAKQALDHVWIQQTAPRVSTASLRSNPALIDNLRNFRSQSSLKKASLQIIAGQLEESQIRGLRETFTALDSNGDGLLTLAELKNGLEKVGFKEENSDLKCMLEGMDTDGSGVIDYTEFLAAALDKRHHVNEQVCWTAFQVFDLNGDGGISVEELRKVLDSDGVEEASGGSMEEVLKDVDKNGDGIIDFHEFMAMMGGTCSGPLVRPAARSPSRSPFRRAGGA